MKVSFNIAGIRVSLEGDIEVEGAPQPIEPPPVEPPKPTTYGEHEKMIIKLIARKFFDKPRTVRETSMEALLSEDDSQLALDSLYRKGRVKKKKMRGLIRYFTS